MNVKANAPPVRDDWKRLAASLKDVPPGTRRLFVDAVKAFARDIADLDPGRSIALHEAADLIERIGGTT